jgi:RecB family exonuclease
MSGKPRPIVLNQSSLKNYNNCQRLFAWQRLEGLEPVGKRSALEIGTAVHAALAVLHSENAVAEAKPLLLKDVPEDKQPQIELPKDPFTAAVMVAEKSLERAAGIRSTFEDKTLEESSEIMRRTLEGYFQHWSDLGQLWTPINQEVQFLVEVGNGTNIWLRGRADNLAIVKGVGLYIVDYKTAGKMDPRDLLKYEMDFQLTAYIYGLTKQLTADSLAEGGGPVVIQGAIVDLLVKTKTPQYAREMFTRSAEELEEFELEFIEYASRIREQLARVEAGEDWKIVFPKNTEHCFRFGTCPFRDVCLRDTPTRRQLYNKHLPDYVDEAQAMLLTAWRKENA